MPLTSIETKINSTWESGKESESRFWRNFFSNQGGKWEKDYLERQNPNSQLQGFVTKYLKRFVPLSSTVEILDAGAGPLTFLGKTSSDYNVNITAIDALANEYNQILSEFGITPIVKTELGYVERLLEIFPPNYFDCAHIRNALDHSYDPLLGIQQMLDVVKPGGYVLINSKINEGEDENYRGLHSWNFCAQDQNFIIWNRDKISLSVNDAIKDIGLVEEINCAPGGQWMFVAIKKNEKQIVDNASNMTRTVLRVNSSRRT